MKIELHMPCIDAVRFHDALAAVHDLVPETGRSIVSFVQMMFEKTLKELEADAAQIPAQSDKGLLGG